MTWTKWQLKYGEAIQRGMRAKLRGIQQPTLEQIEQAARECEAEGVPHD